jgi:hypothetical protein
MKANHGAWALHRYWLWANQFRESLLESLARQGPLADDQAREMVGWIRVPFQSASYWLATCTSLSKAGRSYNSTIREWTTSWEPTTGLPRCVGIETVSSTFSPRTSTLE